MGRNKPHKSAVPHKPKLKKDPGIPKLPDLKIKNAEKQKTRSPPARTDPDATMASEPTLSSLARLASSISDTDPSTISSHPSTDPSSSSSTSTSSSAAAASQKTKEQLRRHYVRALHKVIDESDIVILVLDARDPQGCRSRLVEEEVRRRESEGKKLVFVLNKIDLVPRENAQQWLRYLRHNTPTLPFRSASSNQRSNLSSATAPALLRLLKAYKPSATQSITVGVVGFPNVGKSSLINSLKRSKVCAVAAQPGHTRDLQTVQLERGLKIVDSPGVVFDEDEHQKGSILLRNVVKVEDIDDPIAVVEEILLRTDREVIQKIYNLPEFSNPLEFLTMLALSGGRLLKGGTPDVLSAARHVLMDWNHQKIPYFSIPPSVHPSMIPSTIPRPSHPNTYTHTYTNGYTNGQNAPVIAPGAESVGQAQIVSAFGAPFMLDGLFDAADAGAFGANSGREVVMGDETREEVMVMSDETGEMVMREGRGGGGESDGMIAEDMPMRVPQKRSRSPSFLSTAYDDVPVHAHTGAHGHADTSDTFTRTPKRLRRAKDLSAYEDAAAKSRAQPLSRRALKKDAKKARRAVVRAQRLGQGQGQEQGMAVETEVDALQGTFMVGIET